MIRLLSGAAVALALALACAQAQEALPAAASPEVMLPVAAVTITPGDTITDAMLLDRPFPAGVVARYPVAHDRGQLVGKIARRMLLPGNAILVASVAEAQLVLRGTGTELVFEENGLRITALGVPLESGALGSVVRVKNSDSGRIVSGVVQSDGTVKVGP
ncbi:flagellar basal body P-ring formation chaperone FlgA [Prosthecomicrobium pneumaticum]|uniref:Flagella basal body P-ring formation protein FlgA n=1 Tax=Prosthecomicrobium pneumaticum TaxID=81895 RepID=A0A7W9CTB7_9HYPH|nr:flagellar basal body P-ring formation chaperone FlgA [Prosthecomicrobium pneumaticum]MBB5751022.1 flagella basal body P-ring formation protein FlgA [Prosthecomicrobium pneumaticum]